MKTAFRSAIAVVIAVFVVCSFSGCALFPPKYVPTGSGRGCCGY